MAPARFGNGSRVVFSPMSGTACKPGLFEVLRVLPLGQSNRYEYRVRRLSTGEERVFPEDLLSCAATL